MTSMRILVTSTQHGSSQRTYSDAAATVSDEIEAMPAPADHVATIEALVG
jgi:hypothetical protein